MSWRWVGLLIAAVAEARRFHGSSSQPSENTRSLGPSPTVPKVFNAEEHRVHNLPGLSNHFRSAQYAGGIEVDASHSATLFYWLFECETSPKDAPLLIWINGGPGCSSLEGLFAENGPFRVRENLELQLNPFSWHKVANVLYIDQPAGTGLSYVHDHAWPRNQEQINEHFFSFLQKFFELHPRYTHKRTDGQITRPIYIAGESYAGIYIPSFAAHIMEHNKLVQKEAGSTSLVVNLLGIALGNPWSMPFYQYAMHEFAHGNGLISSYQAAAAVKEVRACQQKLKQGETYVNGCLELMSDVTQASSTGSSMRINLYDIRAWKYPGEKFPASMELAGRYLNRNSVRTALHMPAVGKWVWEECSDAIYRVLQIYDGVGVEKQLKAVLEGDQHVDPIDVLFYVGQYDMMCHHIGVEAALHALEWKGQAAFAAARRGTWVPRDRVRALRERGQGSGGGNSSGGSGGSGRRSGGSSGSSGSGVRRTSAFSASGAFADPDPHHHGRPGGYVRSACAGQPCNVRRGATGTGKGKGGGRDGDVDRDGAGDGTRRGGSGELSFLVVLGAGHMVPMDLPMESLDLIARFVRGESFQDAVESLPALDFNELKLAVPATSPQGESGVCLGSGWVANAYDLCGGSYYSVMPTSALVLVCVLLMALSACIARALALGSNPCKPCHSKSGYSQHAVSTHSQIQMSELAGDGSSRGTSNGATGSRRGQAGGSIDRRIMKTNKRDYSKRDSCTRGQYKGCSDRDENDMLDADDGVILPQQRELFEIDLEGLEVAAEEALSQAEAEVQGRPNSAIAASGPAQTML